MAYKFDATTFDATLGPAYTSVAIGFNLVDDEVIDPETGKPTILASVVVTTNVLKSLDNASAKTQIATDTVSQLQSWLDAWKSRRTKVVDWLSSNETALETYVNSHIVF